MFCGEEHVSSQRKRPFKSLSLQPSLALMLDFQFCFHRYISRISDGQLIWYVVSFQI